MLFPTAKQIIPKMNILKRIRLFITLSFLFGMVSCVPTEKMIYLQSETGETKNVFEYEKQAYRLQANDNHLLSTTFRAP